MRPLALLCVFFSLSSGVAGDTPPSDVNELPVPAPAKWVEHKTLPGRQLILEASGPAKWVPVDEGCDLVPAADGKTATFSAATAGRYRMVVIVGGDPLRVAVTVGSPAPPSPADLLQAKLQAAYESDANPAKKEQIKDLAALYRQAAAVAADPTVQTSGALLSRVQAAAKVLIGADSLKGLRAAAAAELVGVLPVDSPLTPDQRAKAAAAFKHLATILESIP